MLTFLNPSRSYDPTRRCVRFVGHDGMFEIPFTVEADVLAKGRPDPFDSEASYLVAFDKVRGSIQDVAREAYSHGRKTIYALTLADFE